MRVKISRREGFQKLSHFLQLSICSNFLGVWKNLLISVTFFRKAIQKQLFFAITKCIVIARLCVSNEMRLFNFVTDNHLYKNFLSACYRVLTESGSTIALTLLDVTASKTVEKNWNLESITTQIEKPTINSKLLFESTYCIFRRPPSTPRLLQNSSGCP